MRVTRTIIPGVFVSEPDIISDERGSFHESFRSSRAEEWSAMPSAARQVNYSTSHRGVLRGLHGVAVPPGQVKYVTCVRGALQDMVVDARLGSPTFGRSVSTVLDPGAGRGVLVPDGVLHGFLALADDTCISYVLSSEFVPGTQIEVQALDPALALPWQLSSAPVMSPKDRAAPTLAEAATAGLLSRWTVTGQDLAQI